MDACPPQVNKKLWNRFYEPLVLLRAYGKSQGKHVKSDEASSEIYRDGINKRLSERFLDELAYISDYSPSGDTVAAIAIQDGPHLIYWVAANTSQGSKVKPFLSNILELLGQVYNESDEHVSALRHQISDRALVFSAQKLRRYRSLLKQTINSCLPKLERESKEEANILKDWLIHISDSDLDLLGFCRLCYEARDSGGLKAVEQRAKNSSIHEDHTSYEAQFARIRHFIGRLGSHLKAAWILVEAGKHHPQLFTDYSIEIATKHLNFIPPSYRGKSSINGIVNRMLLLEKRIRDEYQNPKFKLRIHAEIILLDLFHRQKLRFWDGIRYIGVRTSGCSNNLYIQWQPPYVQEDLPTLVKEQEDILNMMIKGIRLFVLDKVVPEYQGIRAHPDSTTGLGTSVYTDDRETPLLTDIRHDPQHARASLPQDDESFYICGNPNSTSSGDVEESTYEPFNSDIVEAADNSEEDSDGGGVPLY